MDGSFFPNRPWHISAYWHVVLGSTMTDPSDFINSTNLDYISAHAAELCEYLTALQIIDNFLSELNDSSKIDLDIETDCLGVMPKLERQAIVIIMSPKLHHVVRDFFHFNLND